MTAKASHNWLICFALIAVTLAVYSRVTKFEFLDNDDHVYVTDNDHVKAGLTATNIRWALTTAKDGNRIPLTWLSLMLDHEMSRTAHPYGDAAEDPAVYHRTNLILHILNTLLLFGILSAMTGHRWRSAMVAALFAVHPLHVESVAWVAERKDVLSAFFMMLTLWAYICYVRKPAKWRYVTAALLFALGLMSKSMLMTLPVVLLMLDFWPLKRVAGWTGDKKVRGRTWRQLIVEKLPLLALSAAIGVATMLAQQHGEAVSTLAECPMGVRIANALVSYIAYLWKMVWPVNLSCLYPHPGSTIPVWKVICSGTLLVGITVASILAARRRPYLTVGWLWYVVTLIPVIGIVQVGVQAMADRYTYTPLIGIFVVAVWGVCELAPHYKTRIPVLAILAAAVIAPLSVRAYCQTGYWSDTIQLFTHEVEVTPENAEANNYLAGSLMKDGQTDSAIRYFREAVRIEPNVAVFHGNLGMAYSRMGKTDEAREQYLEAVRLEPNSALFHNELGLVYGKQGKIDQAREQLLEAVRLKPNGANYHNNLGMAYVQLGKTRLAREQFLAALRLDPKCANAAFTLALMALQAGNAGEALRYAEQANRLVPDDPKVRDLLQAAQSLSQRQRSGGKP